MDQPVQITLTDEQVRILGFQIGDRLGDRLERFLHQNSAFGKATPKSLLVDFAAAMFSEAEAALRHNAHGQGSYIDYHIKMLGEAIGLELVDAFHKKA